LNDSYNQAESLYYELIHNLVLETTRLSIESKNLKMRVESMSSRLDFDERRARALEGVVQYRPGAAAPLQPPAGGDREPPSANGQLSAAAEAERRSRRRRRRGRRRPGGPAGPGGDRQGSSERTGGEGVPVEGAGPRVTAGGPSGESGGGSTES
jgi:hypothetical protein